jgi:hypothetical protein
MNVDYVRVFTSSGSGSNPPPPPPSPTPPSNGGGCTGTFASSLDQTSSSSALAWFQPCGWTAGYVILHYQVNNQAQQNVNMSFNGNTSRWEFSIGGLSSGQTIVYSFTYQRDGLQTDTGTTTTTFGGGGGGSAPPPPVSCTGTFASGVNNTGSSSAQAWFQPCGWTAGYVILHYQINGQAQQNVNMSFNSGVGQWQLNISGISSGQVLTYSFTYQRDGLQTDTGVATWTHP